MDKSTMYEVVGSRSKEVLKTTQKAVLSGTLNITQTFKVDLTDDWLYFPTFFLFKSSLGQVLICELKDDWIVIFLEYKNRYRYFYTLYTDIFILMIIFLFNS